MRAGKFVKQLEGYCAFIPEPLPPNPPLTWDEEMHVLLSRANLALGRLDGVTSTLLNPDLFLGMFVKHEAVLSSQIEGTQSTLDDVLQFEAGDQGQKSHLPADIGEVVNYVGALKYGLRRLKELPLGKRLIREIHEKLLHGVRGGHQTPGEFRRTQNWIGPSGCTLVEATFVPPPVHEMEPALDKLESFLHDRNSTPVLIHCALAHAQFETIHPFLDGNGRIGRLLVTFLLCEREILQQPLLYLSYYLKARRTEYYDRLNAIRTDGDWEGWVKFFLRGVFEVSQSATETARVILRMRDEHRQIVQSQKMLDYLFERPIVSINMIKVCLNCSYPTASKLVESCVEQGLLRETTGLQRNRMFRYDPYLAVFAAPAIATERGISSE
ncbi:MAG: Fic family protein [Planctomycetota bacterium]|nr:Fic family protein [Planctomycetota bacterium]